MKKILGIIIYLFTSLMYSQTSGNIANSLNVPTSVASPSVLIGANPVPSGTWKVYIKDDIRWETYNISGLETYLYSKSDVRYKPFTYSPSNAEVITAIGYTPLAFYNEVDPLVSSYIKSIGSFLDIKSSTDILYPSLTGSYTNPTWIISLPYSKITGTPSIPPAQIQTDWNASSGLGVLLNRPSLSTVAVSGSYVDLSSKPTIPTDNNQLINGNGFTTASSTNTFTNKSGNISQWTNNSGYITSFTELDPTVPNYSKSLSAFSIIKSSTDPLYKAIGYSPTSLEITSSLGYTPYNSTNPNGYISSVPSQSFSSLTAKPTTLSGYGIIDAYPLTSNPSNFLTGVTSGQVISALGFTPLSTEVDGSVTNELQSLSIIGSTVSLSNGGGSVVVPSNTYTGGTGISIASNVVTNTNPDQIIVLNSGNRILITGTYPNFTISYIEPVINTPVSRTLNSNFTISTTKQAMVSYSVTCSVTNPLLVGTSSAMSYLEYSINAGSTWLLPAQNGNSSGVGITVTLQLTNGQTGTLVGVIPANALVRLRTTTTGTASVMYVTGTEIY